MLEGCLKTVTHAACPARAAESRWRVAGGMTFGAVRQAPFGLQRVNWNQGPSFFNIYVLTMPYRNVTEDHG